MIVLKGVGAFVMKHRLRFGKADAVLEFVRRVLCLVILNFE